MTLGEVAQSPLAQPQRWPELRWLWDMLVPEPYTLDLPCRN